MRSIASAWWSRIAFTFLFVVAVFGTITALSTAPLPGAFVILILVVSALLVVEQLRGSMQTSGLLWHTNSFRLVVYGAALAVGAIVVTVVTALTLGARLEGLEPGVVTAVLASTLFVIISAALEEVLFRGTVFEALHERFGASVAVLSTSLVFAAAHCLNPYVTILSIANTALAGILLGVLVTQSHSLYAAIAFHATWNVLIGLVVGNVSGINLGIGVTRLDISHVSSPWLFGYAYGIEEGALVTGLLVLGILIVLKTVPLDAETRAARYRRGFSITLKSTM